MEVGPLLYVQHFVSGEMIWAGGARQRWRAACEQESEDIHFASISRISVSTEDPTGRFFE